MIRINFTAEEQQALQYDRFHYPDPRIQVKMEVLWLKSQGLSHTQIAALTGVTTRTVQLHLNEYQQGGIERLKEDRYVGPTSALEPHVVSLREYFEKHPPASVKQAQHAIEQQTGIRREESQVRAFLHRLGMRCRRVGTVPGELNEEQTSGTTLLSRNFQLFDNRTFLAAQCRVPIHCEIVSYGFQLAVESHGHTHALALANARDL